MLLSEQPLMISENQTRIDIIILSYAKNNYLRGLTEQTISTLINSEKRGNILFNILIIESNKSLKPFNYTNTTTIYPRGKFGFNKYINIGLKNSGNDFVCLCNNDLIFHDGWANNILFEFNRDRDLYSASSFCQFSQGVDGIRPNSGLHYGYRIRKEISGWCIMTRRQTFQIIGKPDYNFKFWYSDNDYANLLKKHNLKHALVTSSFVDHIESQTLLAEKESHRKKLTDNEFLYYDYKWNHKNYFLYKTRLYKQNLLNKLRALRNLFR
jgi:GT2 family glycosyltransferase